MEPDNLKNHKSLTRRRVNTLGQTDQINDFFCFPPVFISGFSYRNKRVREVSRLRRSRSPSVHGSLGTRVRIGRVRAAGKAGQLGQGSWRGTGLSWRRWWRGAAVSWNQLLTCCSTNSSWRKEQLNKGLFAMYRNINTCNFPL